MSLKSGSSDTSLFPCLETVCPQFFPTIKATPLAGEWDWIARVRSDGTVTASNDITAGVCGMGLGGDYTVSRAAEWLPEQPEFWLREIGISL